MAWRVEFTPAAAKQLRKLDREIARRIASFLQDLLTDCDDPRQRGKPLTANLAKLWRYRVGDHRVNLPRFQGQSGKVPQIETSLVGNLTTLSPSQEAPKAVVLPQAPFCREQRCGKSAIAQVERSGTSGINVVKLTSYPHWLPIPLLLPPLRPIEPSPPCYGRWRKARASRCTSTGGPSPS